MKTIASPVTTMLKSERIQRLIFKARIFDLRILIAAFVAVLLIQCPVPGQAAEPKAAKPQATAAPAPAQTPAAAPPSAPSGQTGISVADVATQATEAADFLQDITQKLASSPQIEIIRQSLPDVSRQIDQDMVQTTKILQGQPALPTLEAHQEQWQQTQTKTTDWLAVLTKRASTLQEALDRLTGMEKVWEMTLKASQASKAPGPTILQVDQTLAAIKAARTPLQTQLTSVLDLQSRLADEVSKCMTVLGQIKQFQLTAMSGILVQDSLPIVSPDLWTDALTGLPERVRRGGAAYLESFNKYFRDASEGMPRHAGFLAALTLLFLAARYQIRKWTTAGETFSPAVRVFDHPMSAALTLALLLATSPFWSVPIVLRRTFQVLAFAPMIPLVRQLVPVRLVPGLYLLWLLVTIDAVREAFSAELLIGQILLMIESLSGTAVMIWFLRNLRQAPGEDAGSNRLRLLQPGSVLILLVLISGLAAAAMGYMRFARLLTPGVIAGGMLALTMYASLPVVIGVVEIGFHVWPLRTLRMIQDNRDMIERRLYRFLVWAAVVAWTIRYLNYLGLLEPVLSFAKTVLHARYERGDFSISVGGVLEFFLTVWAAYVISALLRFVLREDVYPRIRVAPGKSYALSSLLHYVIITLGFIAGIAVLGINLTKLTVLTGALGVGIGFGLQSVVNNFVSGLILLFERPIQVGDTVEVGDLLGKVRRIGIRASTVHTRQGADIIVPNSQLITEKVTNWTLSDMLRRIDLPVGVNYGAAPKEVIKVLEEVANAHPHVLKDPPPQGLFMGFGDSSINFELRAWTDQFDDWPQIRSGLAGAVYDAVYAAGMTFPFPQREVRLLRDAAGGGSASAGVEEGAA